jgi:L-asparaginase
MSEIKVFTTGGTIDDLEYSSEDEAPANKGSLIPKLLRSAEVDVDYSIEQLMNKDSKFITDEDRKTILESCICCESDKIVITHGTVTMVETALYLHEQGLPKTIVLTGAMIPADQEGSDAAGNVKVAFEAADNKPPGVYIAMSGQLFDADNVRKNIEKGIFEELHSRQ